MRTAPGRPPRRGSGRRGRLPAPAACAGGGRDRRRDPVATMFPKSRASGPGSDSTRASTGPSPPATRRGLAPRTAAAPTPPARRRRPRRGRPRAAPRRSGSPTGRCRSTSTLPGGSASSFRYSSTSIWNRSAGSVSAAAGRCGRWYAPVARTTEPARSSPADVPRTNPPSSSFDRVDRDVLLHGRPGRVALEVAHDLVAGHEPVRVRPVVVAVRELHGPVGRHEAEAVPAAAPGLSDPAALEDDVLDAGLRQLTARREPRLAGADDDDGDLALAHAHIFARHSTAAKTDGGPACVMD